MYRLMLFYLKWIGFWRLPETVETKRVQTQNHLRRVDILRLIWLALVIVLVAVGQAVLFVVGVLLMTFLSFMFLDEAQPATAKVEQRLERRR
ncbi:MAG: hypothetical protein P8X74_07500 [Reinekea sp.]|jgi:hypothetical protein